MMSKYNYGLPLAINAFNGQEKLAAFKEFAEGCPELEECLIELNNNGLYTKACCRGYHEIDNVRSFVFKYLEGQLDILSYARCITAPHIAFEKEIRDVFDYLSEDIINNPNVILTQDENGSVITFHGEDCHRLIAQLTNDIKTGKKNNQDALKRKINVRLTVEQLYNSHLCGLVKSGFSEDEINLFRVYLLYNACCQLGKNMTKEEFDDLCLKVGFDANQRECLEQFLINYDANFFSEHDVPKKNK